MSGEDYIPEPGEPVSPGALRTIAKWLDTYDLMAEVYWDILDRNDIGAAGPLAEVREATRGKQMQDDLRRWADHMERAQTPVQIEPPNAHRPWEPHNGKDDPR